MAITIKQVSSKKELKAFVKFGINLYNNHPYYVPSLILDEINTLSKDKNPASEFCESVYYLAYEEDQIVGRIAGIINRKVNEKYQTQTARFGFVDFVDDPAVSDALFREVENWARNKGMNELLGPLGFTDMDPEGMLIEGYDQMSTMATIYNYPYYPTHLERMKYEKDVDWIEYKIYIPEAIPEKHKRITDIVQKKYGLKVVKFTDATKLVKQFGQQIFDLVNEAYDGLYGYSPLSQRQIDHYIKMYIPLLRLNNVTLIVDSQETLVGVGIAIPSMSKALQKAKGRLMPLGFYHLLKALKGKNDVIDLLLIAIRPDYQNKGVNALLFSDLIPVFIKNGYKYAESNPELEINEKVQSQWQYFDYVQHKRRRAFKKSI